ncbi:GNAT family N-acetyltransferase [Streptomyces nodosus]|uniref:GNAT family N-acetyltransferase n=1 Tax=Streptomyces nodosus TaxID=40318 RepID=UPI0036EA5D5B
MPDCSAQAFAVHGERATAQLPVRAAGGCLTGTALFPLGHAIGALCPEGVLSATAPEPSSDMALKSGYHPERAMAMSLFIAKVHGLTVAEHARDQGFAAALLKRTWQVYEQLGYVLLYGSYDADRDLRAFYTRCGYTVHVPGERFALDRVALPFRLGVGDDRCMFTRWRPRH